MFKADDYKIKIKELKESLAETAAALGLEKLIAEKTKLSERQQQPEVWQDLELSKTIGREISLLSGKIDSHNKIDKDLNDALEILELIEESGEFELSKELDKLINQSIEAMEKLRLQTLLTGKYDSLNAILTLHSGAGGTESCDWVQLLYRMYTRYAEENNYKVTELDRLDGDEAGIKSVDFKVEGANAYGYLKAEKGVHRLVRISPFDSNSRRHTSFASLEVMPEIENDEALTINPDDIKVDTYRSGGAGGQHVNKTDSAVRMTHLPTGIVVQCQNERSQIKNREMAMKMLRSKLLERRESERLEKEQSIKGSVKKIEWGSQIRSYVFCPYTMVKDHRTGYETGNITAVMDGAIDGFIVDYLKKSNEN